MTTDKKKAKGDSSDEELLTTEIVSPFIGADDDDDLSGMEYIEDTTDIIETMPPETKEDRELLAASDEEATDETADEEASAKDGETEDQVPADDEQAASDDDAGDEQAAADESDDDESSSDNRIPQSRFNEVVEERNKLREQIKELQTEEPEPLQPPKPSELDVELTQLTEFDFDAREDEYMDAVNEGEKELAREIRRDIREKELRIAELRAEKIATSNIQSKSAEESFLEVAEELSTKYPVLDHESEVFDDNVQKETLDLFQGYALSGNYSREDALRKAVAQMARIQRWDEESQTDGGESPQGVTSDVGKKIKANNQQPTKMRPTNTRESTPAITEMSDEEFSALPESTMRRLRGDNFKATG